MSRHRYAARCRQLVPASHGGDRARRARCNGGRCGLTYITPGDVNEGNQALRLFTIDAAYGTFEEDVKGSLDEQVFEAMLEGWRDQQIARNLSFTTIEIADIPLWTLIPLSVWDRNP
jgi:hypothetical protein